VTNLAILLPTFIWFMSLTKGWRKKEVVTFFLDFKWNDEVVFAILSNKCDFDSYGNLSYFVFAHKFVPHYKAQQYVVRFSLQFKSMIKVLAKFFPTNFDSNMKIYIFETYSSRISLQAQNCCHIIFFLLDSIKTKEWFLE